MADEPNNCRAVRENLTAYLDGELDVPARRAVDEHLARCPACRQECAALKDAWRLLDEAPAPPHPHLGSDFADRVLARAHTDAAVSPWRRFTASPVGRWVLSGAAAGFAAAIFLGGLYVTTRPAAPPALVLAPAEQECVMYLDVLKDLNALEHLELIKSLQTLGPAAEVRDVLEQAAPEDWSSELTVGEPGV